MPSLQTIDMDMTIEGFWGAWFDGLTEGPNLTQIRRLSTEGYCYLRVLMYFSEFGKCEPMKFLTYLEHLMSQLGKFPEGTDVLTEVSIGLYCLLAPSCEVHKKPMGEVCECQADDVAEVLTRLYDVMKTSVVRVPFEDKNGILHFSGGPNIYCDCKTPMCKHGWTFLAASVLMVSKGKRVGASGFNMEQFLNGGMDEEDEEDFEDLYSSFSVQAPAKKESIKDWAKQQTAGSEEPDVPSHLTVKPRVQKADFLSKVESQPVQASVRQYLTDEGFADKKSPRRDEQQRRAKARQSVEQSVSREVGSNNAMAQLQEQMDHLSETVAKSMLSIQESLAPNDSSSVAERYDGRRFMRNGTILNQELVKNHSGASKGVTALAVEDDMVSGFVQTEDTIQRERESVGRLKPINGLPKPFINNRLNFLMNLSSGIDRALGDREDIMGGLYKAMVSSSVVPVDNLLKQVLCVSIDKHDGVVVSNPFRLPYIEIGMHVSAASLTSMFDLIFLEYKQTWFQEFKGLKVPEFSSSYQRLSQEPLQQHAHRRTRTDRQQGRREQVKQAKPRTILGF